MPIDVCNLIELVFLPCYCFLRACAILGLGIPNASEPSQGLQQAYIVSGILGHCYQAGAWISAFRKGLEVMPAKGKLQRVHCKVHCLPNWVMCVVLYV